MLVGAQLEGRGLTIARMLVALMVVSVVFVVGAGLAGLLPLARPDLYLLSVGLAEGQFVVLDKQFHRVAHRRVFLKLHFLPRDDAHVKEVLAQGSLAPNREDFGGLPNLQFL